MAHEPILIADSVRGIYAAHHAAKLILAQMRDSLLVIRDGTTEDVRTIANVSPTADLDDDQQSSYDAALDAFMNDTVWKQVGHGEHLKMWTGPSGDLFLVPENFTPEND